jgi:hypothetical protein
MQLWLKSSVAEVVRLFCLESFLWSQVRVASQLGCRICYEALEQICFVLQKSWSAKVNKGQEDYRQVAV